MTHQSRIELHTTGNGDLHDLTAEVAEVVIASGIENGIAHVFNIGSTTAIGTIEFEPGLAEDLPTILNRLIPPGRHYGHEQTWHDGNAHSHLQASWLGPECTIPVENNQLILGTWQQIFHLECDNKARQRTIMVTVTGE